MNLAAEDIKLLEHWWIQKSRKNFLAYRMFLRHGDFEHNWFVADLCRQLQNFYLDLNAGKRPVLCIQSPPQHGKSWTISDFISWILGKDNRLRVIYASYSDILGKRCNLAQQRTLSDPKYKKIFPKTKLPKKHGSGIKTTEHFEIFWPNGKPTIGQFRNTTVAGSVTGESLDLGVIDDAVKGREQAGSLNWSQKIWEWFTDDYLTRFSKNAGLLVIMTRWTTHDLIGRLEEKYKELKKKIKIVNYPAIATHDELHRKAGEALFPELKPYDFLMERKDLMDDESWESLYQGSPTVRGGNVIKDDWWKWWTALPQIKFKFITADTAQKDKEKHDWTDFKAWGYGEDGNIYLLDHLREKMTSPTLRRQAEIFYNKHDTQKENPDDPILRSMYIEDKSSGIGLIQELRELGCKVTEVPRTSDKFFRGQDAAPYIKAGRVFLNTSIPDISNTTKEAREFPNSEFDDDIDTVFTAIEVAFIYKMTGPTIGVI
jgi:predicted phage terminase large subunit-like protein